MIFQTRSSVITLKEGGRVMIKKRAQMQKASYDKENKIPVMKCSICNGERVAGFKDIHTGKFEEVMFIRDDSDLAEFKEKYGVEVISKEY